MCWKSAFVSLYYVEPVLSSPPSVPEMEGISTTGGLVFTRMPRESNSRRLRSLLLYLCDVFRALIHSLVCWLCTSALGLVLFQIHSIYCNFPPPLTSCVLTSSASMQTLTSNSVFSTFFLVLNLMIYFGNAQLLVQTLTEQGFFFSRRLSRTSRSTYWLPWDRFSNILHWWDSSSSSFYTVGIPVV